MMKDPDYLMDAEKRRAIIQELVKPVTRRKGVSLHFAWYDLWIGAYISLDNRTVYICPLPCCLIKVRY